MSIRPIKVGYYSQSMSQTVSNPSNSSDRLTRIIVIGVGVLVCGLLFFADKTSLENDIEAGLAAAPAGEQSNSDRPELPPLGTNEEIQALQLQLKETAQNAQPALLDSLIVLLENNGRPDVATMYALDAAEIENTPDRVAKAGILAQKATNLAFIREDNSTLSWFNNQALTKLQAVKESSSQKEDVLLHLGLAFINSGVPENSMQGILTIRSVLEINPDNIEASYQLGNFSIQTSQNEKAAERFRKVLSLDEDRQDARLGLATALINLGQTAAAVPMLETVVTQAKDNELRLQAGTMLENIR